MSNAREDALNKAFGEGEGALVSPFFHFKSLTIFINYFLYASEARGKEITLNPSG